MSLESPEFSSVTKTMNAVFLNEVKDLAEITRILRLRPTKTIKVRTLQFVGATVIFERLNKQSMIHRNIAWIVLSVLLFLTTITWWIASHLVEVEAKGQFIRASAEVSSAIRNRMSAYVHILIHTKAFITASGDRVRREQFHDFVQHADFIKHHPGTLGIGYAQRVAHEDLTDHQQQVRAEGFSDYRVFPSELREEYFPIVMIEPFDWRNQRAFGFDMFSESIRRDAMTKARDTGEPQTSSLVTLMQEVDSDLQPGFLIYVPVFQTKASLDTLGQQQDTLLGFVYSPLRSRDLVRGLFDEHGLQRSQVAIRIYDGERSVQQRILYSSPRFNEDRMAHFQDQIALELPGHIWTIEIQSLPLLEDQLSAMIPLLVLIFGIPSSLIFFKILRINRQHLLKKQQLLEESHKKASRDHLLANAGEILSSANYSDDVLSKLADLLAKYFSDWCVIDLFPQVHKVENIVAAHCDGAKTKIFQDLYHRSMLATGKDQRLAELLRRNPCQIFESPTSDQIGLTNLAPFDHNFYQSLAITSWMTVRLQGRGEVLGTISYGSEKSTFGLSIDDQQFALEFASRLAMILDNARLFRESQQSLALLDSLINTAPVGFAFLDRQLRYGKMNHYLASLHQVDSATVIGKSICEVNPKIASNFKDRYMAVLENGEILKDIEWSGEDPNDPGKVHHWLMTYYPVSTPDEGLIGVGVLSMDITERKRSEDELRRSEARFRLLADSMPQIVWTANTQGEIDYFNQRWTEYTGSSPSGEHILSWAAEIHPDDEVAALANWQQAVSTKLPYLYELRLKHATSQQHRWHLSRAVLVEDPRSNQSKWFGTLTDIHDQKLEISRRRTAEAAVRQLNDDLEIRVKQRTLELQAANKELEAFSYSVSHDLRTPLRGIDGFSRLLQRHSEGVLDNKGRNYLDRVRMAASRMSELIDDMLILSKVSRREMRVQTINLSKLVDEIIDELRMTDLDRKIDFAVQADLVAQADPVLIRAVLENLINNAWKFTQKHEKAAIAFGMLKNSETPTYFVRDDGAGFDMKYVEKLFGTFQRLHSNHEFSGTGIGLATAQRIIRRHGGKIWAEAAVEKGACFYFTLN